MQNIKVTVDGMTLIGTETESNMWDFDYESGVSGFCMFKIEHLDGSIDYEYVWADYPEDVLYVSSGMFAGEPPTIKDIAEWIVGTYHNS